MIGLKEIAAYRPEQITDNFLLVGKHGVTNEFLRDKIGMTGLARKSAADETSDLAVAAARGIFDQGDLAVDQVECLVVVTQNPDGKGIPHTSAIVHNKLDLNANCAVFDVSLGCSGYVQGLAIIIAFMRSQGFKNGLLITADPYSKIVDPLDKDTALIFGDGATATWIGEDPLWVFGSSDFGIESASRDALRISEDGHLTMNGRGVFNFAAVRVPQSVERVLKKSEITMDDIDLVLLHQGSRFIVDTLANRLGAVGKTPFTAGGYGNTISSSIPMLLLDEVPSSANRMILSGFGVGLAWATCLLERLDA